MLTRLIAIILAFVSANALAAQEHGVITVAEWQQELQAVTSIDSVSLTNLATQYATDSAALLKSNSGPEAQKKSLMALALMRYAQTQIGREGKSLPATSIEAVNTFEAVLIKNGLTASVIRQSVSNLQSVMASDAMAGKRSRQMSRRAATVAERAAMIDVIKATLYDPTTPIFGRSDISGDLACVTMNARNRLGALTGNQEAILYFNRSTGSWTGGETVNVSHDVCLSMADSAGG